MILRFVMTKGMDDLSGMQTEGIVFVVKWVCPNEFSEKLCRQGFSSVL